MIVTGRPKHAHAAGQALARVGVQRQVVDPDFVKEPLHRGQRIAARGDGHDLHLVAAHRGLQC